MRLARAPQRGRGLRRIVERFGKRALIRKRKVNDLRLGDGALRRLPGGRHHEIAHAAALDLGGAFDDRKRLRRQPRLQPGRTGAVAGHGKSSQRVAVVLRRTQPDVRRQLSPGLMKIQLLK
jgi:hypothetical protein